jgi:hypothetical protein
MPVPIICLEITLRQYAEAFHHGFTRPQFQHFITVLLGLILAPERRTLSGLRSRVAVAVSLSAFSRFFSQAPWTPGELAQTWLGRFRQQLMPAVQAEHARLRAQQPCSRGRHKPTHSLASMTLPWPNTARGRRSNGWPEWASTTAAPLARW